MARYDWPAPPRGEDDPMGREGHVAVLRPTVDPTTIAPPKPRARRRRTARAPLGDAPVGNQNLWFPIGPSVMTHGQAGGDPNVAGRIRDVQIEPTDGLRIYAASAGGGAWFSADRGETWSPLDDFQQSDRINVGDVASALSCGAIYVRFGADADGSKDVVWVGTGEPVLREGGQLGGVGGLPGGKLAGIGFLHRDPAVGPAWTLVEGDAADPHALRGARCYRIAADPGNLDQLVAGTTEGLYLLTPGGSWTRVTTYPVSPATQPLDVVLTRPDAGNVRIWVGVPSGVLAAEVAAPAAAPIAAASLTFTPVDLPNVNKNAAPTPGGTRVQLATDGSKVYVLGRRTIAKGEKRTTPPAHLWSIDATAALASLKGTEVTGLPPDLFMSLTDQSDYDMCIAAHPSTAGQVYVGGAVANTSTGSNAALYRCQIAGTTATLTPIGEGVHADVHVVRLGPAAPSQPTKRTVWVGCDGGLFRSDSDGDARTFADRNNGLAVLQPGYVASHPTNPGIVAAGFQDNGTAVRIGDGLWEQRAAGDGGGIVFDPDDDRYFAQYTRATWNSSDNSGVAPVHRRNPVPQSKMRTSEKVEDDTSLFYSGADAVALGGDVHLAFGSDRVWYTRDWGRSWVTLPTATDPRAADNPDLGQDVLHTIGKPGTFIDRVGSTDSCASTYIGTAISGSGIIAVKFAEAPNDSAGNLVLRVLALYASGLVWFTGTRAPPPATGAFAWAKPATLVRQEIRDPNPGAEQTDVAAGHPLQFLPAPGKVSDVAVHRPDLGTLGSCYVTTTGGAIPIAGAPPADRDTLWFFDGTDKWHPTGLRISHGNGTWSGIQVTAPALGVVVDPDDRSKVYVGTSVGVVKGTLAIGGTPAAPTYAWTWEQFVNGLPEAAVQDLSIRRYGGFSLLRVALQSRGVWETDVGNSTASPLTYLRLYPTDTRRVLPTPTGGPLLAGDARPVAYDNSPDIAIDTTGTVRPVPPTEWELSKIPRAGAATAQAQVSISERHPQVHVLVHQRWSDPAPPAQVRVALLRHAMPASGVVALGGLWAALVSAATSGTPPASLPDGWSQAGAALWQNPAGPVEPRLPRAVTFALDLSGDASGTAILLLAVVMSDSNQISAADLQAGSNPTATTADQLVLSSPHVAAKSIVIR
jgi:hypothetical protein